MSGEIRPIREFPGYGISSNGKVWRITKPHDGIGARRKVPYEISPGSNPSGYKIVTMVKDGKSYGRSVHRLVLEAFVGPCPPMCQGAHNDGNKLNNNVSNLRWASASDNQADRTKHGTHMWGQHNPRTVLADTDIPFIRSYPHSRHAASFLAAHYGVKHAVISKIRNHETWRRVP